MSQPRSPFFSRGYEITGSPTPSPGVSGDVFAVWSSCKACTAGRYQASAGSLSCTFCARGRFSFSHAVFCIDCPPGKFLPDNLHSDSGNCEPCAEGKHQDQAGQASCADCTPGQFIDVTGRRVCTMCPVGKHSLSAGADRCIVGAAPAPVPASRALLRFAVVDARST